MPTVEEYLRSTERPQRMSLPIPVAVALPERVRRQASAKRPPRIRRKYRGRPHAKLRGALGVTFVAGVIALGISEGTQDNRDGSRNESPIVITIGTLPPPGSLPVFTCPASQPSGLTATQDVVIALVQIRAAAAANPVADCTRHVWSTGAPPAVDDFYRLGLVRSTIAISDFDGPPNAALGAIVHFALSNNGTRLRFETQLTKSADDREWRLAYLRAVPT